MQNNLGLQAFRDDLTSVLPTNPQFHTSPVEYTGKKKNLPSWFAVSELAAASFAVAASELAALMASNGQPVSSILIDRRLAAMWFDMTLRPQGWQLPSPWDPIAGDYPTQDGWIRLHTNAPHHRVAVQRVLAGGDKREDIARAVAKWPADALEQAIVEQGGCAATMRNIADWQVHPQGKAVAREALVVWQEHQSDKPLPREKFSAAKPLRGVRILDLTRVLAGPVAGRFLAGYGAEVLRIDPPHWDEPGVIPEVTLGKRCAGLDLKKTADRIQFEHLVRGADILLHGYRPGAMENLGFGHPELTALNPVMINVRLSAYGWSGPWAQRRGFDSLVQMSTGLAAYGMTMSGADRPVPLPVQALDHATGYLMAASVLHALRQRGENGRVLAARLSLARTARALVRTRNTSQSGMFTAETPDDLAPGIEATDWGAARRIRFPVVMDGVLPEWPHAAGRLRSARPHWLD